ncbi:MAG: FtsX-like permease family protein [Lentisphaeraceae bacterium]|nr:FtsX-like permease family protein [Lentisphaeraceae bacterium]
MLLYTLRNLIKAPIRTLQLSFGSFLVLLLLFTAYAFQSGMEKSLRISGDAKNIILMGTGSEESVERSEVPLGALSAVSSIRGLKKVFGKAAVSPEAHYNTQVTIAGEEREVMMRGVKSAALHVYSQVSLLGTHFPRSGEIMAGRLAWKRLGIAEESLQAGSKLIFEGKEFTISGHFAAPGTVMESELWINLNDLMALTRRDSLSCITVRLDKAEFADVDLFCKQRLDLQLSAITEKQYYSKLGQFYEPVKLMAWLTAILIAAGAFFGGMNTFYAAITARVCELASLQALGYSRRRLFCSLYGEALLIHIFAWLSAAGVALYFFPQIHLNFGSSFFSLVLESQQMLELFFTALVLALCVIILPAWRCLKPPLRDTLRD